MTLLWDLIATAFIWGAFIVTYFIWAGRTVRRNDS